MSYTLGTAAKATGKDRATISRAIKKGRISAAKNDSGEWQIDPSELHRVYPPLKEADSARNREGATESYTELRTESRVLEVKFEAALQRIEALEADKAFLQTELTKATTLLTDQRRPQAAVERRSWWSRLFGAGRA
jgi:hypothetical protein